MLPIFAIIINNFHIFIYKYIFTIFTNSLFRYILNPLFNTVINKGENYGKGKYAVEWRVSIQ
jgi:hypothetical protein